MSSPTSRPKILVFDIETYGGLKAHMSEVSAFGYKWLGEGKDATVLSGLDFPREFKRDFTNDRPLLEALSKVWNEADAVIAHYGERFDRRFLNSRIEKHSLAPLKPLKLIDTWRIAKDNFALHSNRLDALLQFFGSPHQKLDLAYDEWRRVIIGDKKALTKLIEHCRNDVLGLEWVFQNHLFHYTNKLPNYGFFVDPGEKVCPYCGSDRLIKRGQAHNQTTVMQRYQCLGCRRWPSGPMGKGVLR